MRHLATWPSASRVVASGLLLMVLLAAGCSSQHAASDHDPLSPGSSASAILGPDPAVRSLDGLRDDGVSHMPLAVGNRWDYVIRLRSRLVANGTSDVIQEFETPWTSEIVSVQPIGEHEYFMQAEYDPRVVSRPPSPSWGLRQDHTGLYSYDLIVFRASSTGTPATDDGLAARFRSALASTAAKSRYPAAFAAAAEQLAGRLAIMSMPGRGKGLPGLPAAPGSVRSGSDGGAFRRGAPLPGEISLLVYPLAMGSRWIVRDSPRFSRAVVGRGTAQVPGGDFSVWVQRGFSEVYGPNDRVYFSYAREGLIQIKVHAEQEVTDNQGNPLGRMIFEMDQSLSALTISPPSL